MANPPITPPATNPVISNDKFTYSWYNWMQRVYAILKKTLTADDTASSASAGVASLPTNPVGFIVTTLEDGTQVKVPYYDP